MPLPPLIADAADAAAADAIAYVTMIVIAAAILFIYD